MCLRVGGEGGDRIGSSAHVKSEIGYDMWHVWESEIG